MSTDYYIVSQWCVRLIHIYKPMHAKISKGVKDEMFVQEREHWDNIQYTASLFEVVLVVKIKV